MSTEYLMIEKLNREEIRTIFSIGEHSNLFDLDCFEYRDVDGYSRMISVDDLTLDDLKEISQELVNVISYFDPDFSGTKVKY